MTATSSTAVCVDCGKTRYIRDTPRTRHSRTAREGSGMTGAEVARRTTGVTIPTDPITLGNVLAASGFFQDSRDGAQAAVKVMAGQELGFGAIASMTGIYIVKGRVTLSANLMAAAVKRHPAYTFRVTTHTDEACSIDFIENGEVIGVSAFTMADAQRAGLANSDTWKKFPKNMLYARALSNGAKWYCPDAFGGAPVYTPDELGATVNGDGEVIGEPELPVVRELPAPDPVEQRLEHLRGLYASHDVDETELQGFLDKLQIAAGTLGERLRGLSLGDQAQVQLFIESKPVRP